MLHFVAIDQGAAPSAARRKTVRSFGQELRSEDLPLLLRDHLYSGELDRLVVKVVLGCEG